MQSNRWINTSVMASKITIKKRAGSLSPEKLAQIQQELFPADSPLDSSPSNSHNKSQIAKDNFIGNNSRLQQYPNQYLNGPHQIRNDGKISKGESIEKLYYNISPVPYKGSAYNNGNEIRDVVASRAGKTAKRSPESKGLDLEGMMAPEAKRLFQDLEQLTTEERMSAMIVDQDRFSMKIQQEIDCVGCVSSLHTYLNELSEIASKKSGSVLYFEGLTVYGDKRIGVSEEKIGNILNTACVIYHHKSKDSIIDELTRSLNIKRKHDGHNHKGKNHARCLLHSKKSMPNGIWREALQNLIEYDVNEVASVVEIDESAFFSSLQIHTERGKFCSTCKENIRYVYEKMLEEASNCSDCEDEEDEDQEGDDEGDEEEEEEEEVEEEEEEEDDEEIIEIQHREIYSKENINPTFRESIVRKTTINGEQILEYHATREIPRLNENRIIDEQIEKNNFVPYARKTPGDLLTCIKYCRERGKIIIPLEMEIFMEFLSKAENGIATHIKHANTKEAAQEELVACIGTCLKERLQSIWRAKKGEELAKFLFLKLAADCIVEGIQRALEEKNFRLGHKTAIEEYLNETEAAEQQKKEKLRQKRQKRKEKKKGKKPNEEAPSPTNSSKANLDEEDFDSINETKDTKSANKNKDSEKHHGPPLSHEANTNKPPNEESKDQKKQQKNKNILNSPIFDKASTNSNTPESRTSFEKNMAHLSDQKKPLETKPMGKNSKNGKNQKETISDERERNLLLAMGWSEEPSEAEVVVDEKDLHSLKQKWKEIETSRANFRKNAKEKFMSLMSSK